MTNFVIKGKKPIWSHLEYDEIGIADSKEEAMKIRAHAQQYGYIKVFIKKKG